MLTDLITSQNALAHINDLQDTFKLIYSLLKEAAILFLKIGYFLEVF